MSRHEVKIGVAVWRDGRLDCIHWAVGDQMVPRDSGTMLMWTACGKFDIPANAALRGKKWTDGRSVDCELCKTIQSAHA